MFFRVNKAGFGEGKPAKARSGFVALRFRTSGFEIQARERFFCTAGIPLWNRLDGSMSPTVIAAPA